MEITDKLIEHLAQLAKLEFNEEEKISIKADLAGMIAFIEKLNEADTAHLEPLLHISPQSNVFREDEVKHSITRQEALLNAPLKNDHFFKAPKVINKER